ncbi:MAG: 16S rRNA processing protein RimM, partial [Terracidiphilus sp.]
MAATEDWAWVARIRRPQGRKGEVWAEILTDFPEKFNQRRELWLLEDAPRPKTAPRPVTLANHWLHKGGVVLHFAGVDSISGAETLAGLVVAVPWAERVPLGADEAYIGDLTGCILVDVAGQTPASIGAVQVLDHADRGGRLAGHIHQDA